MDWTPFWSWALTVMGFFFLAGVGVGLSRVARSRKGRLVFRDLSSTDWALFWAWAVVYAVLVLVFFPAPALAHAGCEASYSTANGLPWSQVDSSEKYHTPNCGPPTRYTNQEAVFGTTRITEATDSHVCHVVRDPGSCRCTFTWPSLECRCTPSNSTGSFSSGSCQDLFSDEIARNTVLNRAPRCKATHYGLERGNYCAWEGDVQSIDDHAWRDAYSSGFFTTSSSGGSGPALLTCGSIPTSADGYASDFSGGNSAGQDVNLGYGITASYACANDDLWPSGVRSFDNSAVSQNISGDVECLMYFAPDVGRETVSNPIAKWHKVFGCHPPNTDGATRTCSSKSLTCNLPPIPISTLPGRLSGIGYTLITNDVIISWGLGSDDRTVPDDVIDGPFPYEVGASDILVYRAATRYSSGSNVQVQLSSGYTSDDDGSVSSSDFGCYCAGEDSRLFYRSRGYCDHSVGDTFTDPVLTPTTNTTYVDLAYCDDPHADVTGRDTLVHRSDGTPFIQFTPVDGDDGRIALGCASVDNSLCTYSTILVTLGEPDPAQDGFFAQLPKHLSMTTSEEIRSAHTFWGTRVLSINGRFMTWAEASEYFDYGFFPSWFYDRATVSYQFARNEVPTFSDIGGPGPFANLPIDSQWQVALPQFSIVESVLQNPANISLMFTGSPIISTVQVAAVVSLLDYMTDFVSYPFDVLINPFNHALANPVEDGYTSSGGGRSSHSSANYVPECPSGAADLDLSEISEVGFDFPNARDPDEPYEFDFSLDVTLSAGELICGFLEPAGPWIRSLTYFFFVVMVLYSTFSLRRGVA